MKTSIEVWVPVQSYERHYEVSSWGRVRSLSRVIRCGPNGQYQRMLVGRILATRPTGPYDGVQLSKENKVRPHYVHILVAQAFVPNDLGLPQVNHKDGDKRNNKATNLEWTTNKGNYEHALSLGLIKVGSARSEAKLTEKSVKKIRKLIKNGMKFVEIAKQYNVHPATISMLHRGKSWRHCS